MARLWGGRAFVSIAKLGKSAGLSKYETRKALESNGVQIKRHGVKRVVWRSDLELAFPTFIDSIRFNHEDDE